MIVLLHGAPTYGAVERYVEALVHGLQTRNEPVVLVHPRALEPFARLAGGNVRTIAFEPAGAAALALRLVRLLRRLRPRLAHVTEVWPPAAIATRVAAVPRILVTHHTPELPRRDNAVGRAIGELAWRMRPEIIYTSESQRERDRRTPSHVIPLGIDLERFAAARPGLDLEGTLIGNVARLAEQKGQRDLIDAAPLVLERHPDARFVLVGDGELRSELEQRAARLGDRVVFLGERDDVPEVVASFELCAFPSLFEGFCVAAVEAQAAGVPVVATPVGGLRDTVVDGVTGFLVPPRDPRALSARLMWCLEHPGEARAVAAEAQRRAERWSEARMVADTLALYGEKEMR